MTLSFRHAELVSASISDTPARAGKWVLKQVQDDAGWFAIEALKLLGISLDGSVG